MTRPHDPEPILEPSLPIVDPHHHLWDLRPILANSRAPGHDLERTLRLRPRYLFEDLLCDLTSGHNIRKTVFVECRSMYRAQGPDAMKPVGETEFVNGVAAMSASGIYGEVRACTGIVGHADLQLGELVEPVLEAHIAAAGGRFRGIRHSAAADADPQVLGPLAGREPGLYCSQPFRQGFARLQRFGLSFDAWILEPQLGDLIRLARAFPDTQIIVDHVGTPLGIASYAGRLGERFAPWRDSILALSRCPNVCVKLGGLGMPLTALPSAGLVPPAGSARLAAEWRPFMETCISAFGVDRCMFESNFPVDLWSCSYDVLWNAMKRIAAGCSSDEKNALFSATATRVYRL
jgi:L-fuconolactonase